MLPTDPILADPRGSIEAALARGKNAKRHNEFVKYVHEVFRLAPIVGIDPAIVIAQWDLETATGTSRWWVERLNPAGMGITGWGPDDEKSRYFADGVDAARAQIAHLLLYTLGRIDRGGLTPADDPRYDAYVDAYGTNPTATTIVDLNGRWAIDKDKNYHGKIASRGNQIWPNLGPFVQEQPKPVTKTLFEQTTTLPNTFGGVVFGFTITEADDDHRVQPAVTITDAAGTTIVIQLNDASAAYLGDTFASFKQHIVAAGMDVWMEQFT